MTVRCFLAVLLILIGAAIQVHSQGANTTYLILSIDCGLSNVTEYTDPGTNISYTSDTQYIDTGTNYNIHEQYNADIGGKPYETVRSFPQGARNCYTLPSKPGQKYLVRATFGYGNYDKLNSTATNGLVFGLHIGVNFWSMVNLTSMQPTGVIWKEVLTVAPDNFVSVCLVNMGLGTPFISTLEMRLLDATMYPFVNTSVSVSYFSRHRFGQPSNNYITRYPEDPFDRFWERWQHTSYPWLNLSSAEPVRAPPGTDSFQVPRAILQCAATVAANFSWLNVTVNATGNLDAGLRLLPVFHFAELNATANRTFDIYNDGDMLFSAFTPSKFLVGFMYHNWFLRNGASTNFTLRKTPGSLLPPLINAFEVYSLVAMENATTGAGEVDSMKALKKQYNVTMRNWEGDPCSPREYAWEGVSCDYSPNGASPAILGIDLSASGLNGTISPFLANMTALAFLDLSNNKLTGSIPDNLAILNSLQVLNLSNNQLTGPVPDALVRKSQGGLLKLRLEGNPLCSGVIASYCRTKPKNSAAVIAVAIVVPLVVVLVVSFIVWRLRCKGRSEDDDSYLMEEDTSQLQIDTRRFTYAELQVVTSRFERVLGKGGFGTVYYGILENGNEIAVKVLKESSIVDSKDFLPEVQTLSRVHHKNLVSLVGYCNNRRCLALVYEFMHRGNLQDLLRGEECDVSWGERLRIAVDAAQGLEYLHEACSPPIVHRDVKTANILLDEKLDAKIADFGLSRTFQTNAHTHITTAVAGTLSYLDPEYYVTYQVTTKTDVYSFGVVLLEMVTGKPSVHADPVPVHIAQWVRQKLAMGTLDDIVDARLIGQYDAESVQIVINLAMKCLEQSSIDRPSMANVVARLKECLLLVPCEKKEHKVDPKVPCAKEHKVDPEVPCEEEHEVDPEIPCEKEEHKLDPEEVVKHKNVLELEIPRQQQLASEVSTASEGSSQIGYASEVSELHHISAR